MSEKTFRRGQKVECEDGSGQRIPAKVLRVGDGTCVIDTEFGQMVAAFGELFPVEVEPEVEPEVEVTPAANEEEAPAAG